MFGKSSSNVSIAKWGLKGWFLYLLIIPQAEVTCWILWVSNCNKSLINICHSSSLWVSVICKAKIKTWVSIQVHDKTLIIDFYNNTNKTQKVNTLRLSFSAPLCMSGSIAYGRCFHRTWSFHMSGGDKIVIVEQYIVVFETFFQLIFDI